MQKMQQNATDTEVCRRKQNMLMNGEECTRCRQCRIMQGMQKNADDIQKNGEECRTCSRMQKDAERIIIMEKNA